LRMWKGLSDVRAGPGAANDVSPRAVVGNPARVVKTIDELECPYELMERL
jgi:acetyltransferase-like isoleucine patch superfamily enzyme